VRRQEILVLTLATLLYRAGSGVAGAVLVGNEALAAPSARAPFLGNVTTTVKVTEPPDARLGDVQVSSRPSSTADALAETSVEVVGSSKVETTFLAAPGPAFFTVRT
jgi:hypothetical protein